MKNQIMKIKTPVGYIVVLEKGTEEEYPGVYVCHSPDGESFDCQYDGLIACVDYDAETGRFLTETYSESDENPVFMVAYPSGEPVLP